MRTAQGITCSPTPHWMLAVLNFETRWGEAETNGCSSMIDPC